METTEKDVKALEKWNEFFLDLNRQLLSENLTIEDMKEIFAIGSEIFRRKRRARNGSSNIKKIKT